MVVGTVVSTRQHHNSASRQVILIDVLDRREA